MADPHDPAADADADAHVYERGTMEIVEHTETWHLFMALAKWGSLSIATAILFLVMWFHHGGSFFTALIAAVVVFAAGFFFLKSGGDSH